MHEVHGPHVSVVARFSPPDRGACLWLWPLLVFLCRYSFSSIASLGVAVMPFVTVTLWLLWSILGHHFLVVNSVDPKWLEAFPCDTMTTATMEKLQVLLSQTGLPDMLVTDNGTNFVSAEFEESMHWNGIHVMSALAQPASNGLVERAFKERTSWMQSGSINRSSLVVPVCLSDYASFYDWTSSPV